MQGNAIKMLPTSWAVRRLGELTSNIHVHAVKKEESRSYSPNEIPVRILSEIPVSPLSPQKSGHHVMAGLNGNGKHGPSIGGQLDRYL